MASQWSLLVKAETDTKGASLDTLYNFGDPDELDSKNIKRIRKNVQTLSGSILTNQLDEFERFARTGDDVLVTNPTTNNRINAESPEAALSA
jgi:hypothetical protein